MSTDIIGQELLGQFRVIEKIGVGGMGEVYKAQQPSMDRLVAIKILHEKLTGRKDLISRFRREARAMSRLTHPNTVRVFLYGQLENTGQLYIVMEHLEGMDLAAYVRKNGPMESTRAIKVMIQMLGALEEAHNAGVVHRDLKPENILLTTQGGIPDFPKVLDFGLAKIRETKLRPGSMVLTQEGMIFGTPEFMSPEQARGQTLDSRSDIYSVSLIFYELVTGRLPFPKGKPMEYITHHINTQPTLISKRRPELNLPAALDPIISRALEKDREMRFQSSREFAEALKGLLSPESTGSSMLRAVPKIKNRIKPPKLMNYNPISKRRPDDNEYLMSGSSGKKLILVLISTIAILLGVVIWMAISSN